MKKQWTHSLLLWLLLCQGGSAEFAFEDARILAEHLAAQPFHPASNEINEAWLSLSYEQYQAIRFDHDRALWRKDALPFQLEFFLPGNGHKQTVALHEIDDRGVRKIPFDASPFNLGKNRSVLPTLPGYAGFRIVRSGAGGGEVAAFLDASYFRMIGYGEDYGTSGRGLALNTVANESEEFPVFQQFWIRRPEKNSDDITVFALMDSRSVAGAFRFDIHPGTATVALVKAAIFPRREVKEFGIAPLTSMFLFGKNGHVPFCDFRPEVHDADGLLIHNGQGDWIWRPLEAGKTTGVEFFRDEHPNGFGLLQRERDFECYQDLVARYHHRPSVWVRPVGNWGKGSVELVELASDQEYFDNVVVFWKPDVPPSVGRALEIDYELLWTTNSLSPPELGHVRATRIGRIDGKPPHLRFVVEFGGIALESLPRTEELTPSIDYGAGGERVTHALVKNEFNQAWRLIVEIVEPPQAVNLRAFLSRGGRRVTETWNYTWRP